MNPTYKTFKRMLMATATTATVLCALVACSDSADGGEDEDDNVRVTFTLSVASTADATRADNEGWDDYNPDIIGSASENAINTADLQIRICDSKGQTIANVDDIQAHRTSSTQYTVSGTWNDAKGHTAQASRIMITANCHAQATASLATLAYDAQSLDQYLPMWGVATLPARLVLGKSNNIGTVSMLRAMAKVCVQMRSDMAGRGYSIASLKIAPRNTRGYCVPKTWESVASTEDIRFDGSLNPLESVTTQPLDFTTQLAAYIPEYDNTSAGATPATVSVTLNRNGETDDTYTLYFRHYNSDGEPTGAAYDIQRNHLYNYIIYKESDKVLVTLHVRPWYLREHDDIIM